MITITWKIEGLSADAAVDLDASIRRFQALAAEALTRDGLGGESVSITCKIASYIASEPEPEDSAAVRTAQVVYQVWHVSFSKPSSIVSEPHTLKNSSLIGK